MCVSFVIPFIILDVRLLVDAPAGFAQEKGHTGSLHLPSAVLALVFISRKDSAVPFPRSLLSQIFCTHEVIVLLLMGT